MTTRRASATTLAEIRSRLKADPNATLTLSEVEAILPGIDVETDDLPAQLIQLRTYIDDRSLELTAARQLRDRDIAALRRTQGMSREAIAGLADTSVAHVGSCIGGRVPGAYLR